MNTAVALAVALPLYANALVVAARRRGWDLWAAYTPGNAAVGLALITLTTLLGDWSGALGGRGSYDSVLRGLLAGAVVALPVVAIAWSPTRLGRAVRGAGVGGVTPATLAYRLIVQVLLCTVAFEELAFRGVLYGALAADYGSIMAVWGSAASFSLWACGSPDRYVRRAYAAPPRRSGGRRPAGVWPAGPGVGLAAGDHGGPERTTCRARRAGPGDDRRYGRRWSAPDERLAGPWLTPSWRQACILATIRAALEARGTTSGMRGMGHRLGGEADPWRAGGGVGDCHSQ